jgi:glutaredoxin 3
MNHVVIYTAAHCPYCDRAKQLLQKKGMAYTEIAVDTNDAEREIMIARSGRRTVPQIFIDDKPIGGCDDLYALYSDGRDGRD